MPAGIPRKPADMRGTSVNSITHRAYPQLVDDCRMYPCGGHIGDTLLISNVYFD